MRLDDERTSVCVEGEDDTRSTVDVASRRVCP